MPDYPPLIVDGSGVVYSNALVVGVADLAAGTVDVAYPRVTSGTYIFVAPQAGTANLGSVAVSARTAGVGFTVLSTNPLDSRRVAWLAIEP